jgi:hypothetical protein
MEVHQKTKSRPTYHPAIPLLGIYPKEWRFMYKRDTWTPMFIVAVFTTANCGISISTCPSIDEWIKKMWYTQQCVVQP